MNAAMNGTANLVIPLRARFLVVALEADRLYLDRLHLTADR